MGEGLTTTFRVLAQTDSEAVGRVLASALDCTNAIIQEEALVGILKRRDLSGQRELLRRWDSLSGHWREIIKKYRSRMIWALRDAMLGNDMTMCANACHAAVWIREYDLVPVLLNTLGEPLSASGDLAAITLLGLTEQLYEELASPPADVDRRDPQLVRQHVVSGLEEFGAALRPPQAARGDRGLSVVGQSRQRDAQTDPSGSAPRGLSGACRRDAEEPTPGVVRLLLNFLDDPHAPSAAMTAVGNRGDVPFVRYLLRKIGREPSPVVRQNLKRITSIACLRSLGTYLEQLDDGGQHALVRLVMASGVPREQVSW